MAKMRHVKGNVYSKYFGVMATESKTVFTWALNLVSHPRSTPKIEAAAEHTLMYNIMFNSGDCEINYLLGYKASHPITIAVRS
jgi:hypothetical protein